MPLATVEQQREYQRKWKKKRRTEWFEGKHCVVCGSTERLELDHIDPTTKIHHDVWSWSEKRRKVELAKCQVLCFQCHRDKTHATTFARGNRKPNAKLNPDAVRQIRESTENHRTLAIQFGVSEKLIRLVRSGESWPHIT